MAHSAHGGLPRWLHIRECAAGHTNALPGATVAPPQARRRRSLTCTAIATRDGGVRISHDSAASNVSLQRWSLPQQVQGLELEQLIKAGGSAAAVLSLVDCSPDLSAADAAAALSALSRLLRGTGQADRQEVAQHPAVTRLHSALLDGIADLPPGTLASLLQHSVWLGLTPPPALLNAVTEQLTLRLETAKASEVCLAAWALTKLGHSGVTSLLQAVEVAVVQGGHGQQQEREQQQHGQQQQQPQHLQQQQQQHQEQQPQQPQQQMRQEHLLSPWLAALQPAALVNLLWAAGKAGYRSVSLLNAIATALSSSTSSDRGAVWRQRQHRQHQPRQPPPAAPKTHLDSLNAQQLSMLFYSAGLLKWALDEQFLRGATAAAQRQLHAFAPQGLSNTAWGLTQLPAAAQATIAPLVAALLREATPRLSSFKIQELSMCVMAAASPGPAWRLHRGPLMAAAAAQVAARHSQIGGRDLVTILSAFATVGYEPPAAVLGAATRRLDRLAPSLAPATLSWLLWALAHMRGHPTPRSLLRKVEAALRGQLGLLYALAPADVARLCWSLSELNYFSGALLADLAAVNRSMWERMGSQSMAMALHSYAQQQYTPHELLDVAAEHLVYGLPAYSPQAVATVMWAFGKLQVHPGRGLPGGGPCTPDGVPVMAAVADYTLQRTAAPQQQQQQQGGDAAPPSEQPFNLQGLSMVLWAFAKLEHNPGDQLLQAVSARFVAELRQGQATDAAAAVGDAVQAAVVEVTAAEAAAAEAGDAASPLQAVASVGWSLSHFGFAAEDFFTAVYEALPELLAAQARQGSSATVERSTAHAIALLAQASTKLRVAAAVPLLRLLLPVAEQRVSAFNAEELCHLLWALAHAAVQPPLTLLDAAVGRLADQVAVGWGGSADEARLLCLAAHSLALLSYRADPALLHGCVRAAAAAVDELPVSLLCKLVWGCAHVGHDPPEQELGEITGNLYYRLSHARGNSTVLNVPDLIHLLWGLAALQQYHSQLYSNLAFRATRLPDGVPEQPHLRRLLREATVLHSIEHKLSAVAASAAAAILPAWMASQQQQEVSERQEQQRQSQGGAAAAPVARGHIAAPVPPRQLELRTAAEAVCETLRRHGLPASLKQLSFGDFLVLLDLGRGKSEEWRELHAAVVPLTAPGRAAVNAPDQPLGSALVARRVLEVRGLPTVLATADEAQLVAACRGLLVSA